MKFHNYKNKLERPFVVYMDCEASLIPMEIRDNEKNIKLWNIHVINSCCFYFVCSFDSTRNNWYDFRGVNCLAEMVNKLYEIAKECIEEMKETAEWDWLWRMDDDITEIISAIYAMKKFAINLKSITK